MRKLATALLVLVSFGCSSARWKVGDTVCFKLTGKRGTVSWASGPYNPPYYSVMSVDDLNHIYKVTVNEPEIQECQQHER